MRALQCSAAFHEQYASLLHDAGGRHGCCLGGHSGGMPHAAPRVDEADPQAKSLGYRKDTGKLDDKQYPKHAAAQRCSAWMKKAG